MARSRSPDREKAFEIWQTSGGQMKLKDIAAELGVSDSQIRKWKNQDRWDERLNSNVTNPNSNVTKRAGAPIGNKNAVGHGAPADNKNAVGNSGGGAPLQNTNAVKTGEYQSLWMDALTPEQVETLSRIDLNPLHQTDEEIQLFAWREREMMMRIKNLKEGLTEKQRRVLQERLKFKDVQSVCDEKSGQMKSIPITREELVVTEIEETDFRPIEDILRIEEALTRVQDKKLKAIELKLKHEEQRLRLEKLKAEIAELNQEDQDDEKNSNALDSLAKAIADSKKFLVQKMRGDA